MPYPSLRIEKKIFDMKFISWNVNGIRALIKKGFYDFLRQEDADFYCFQEIKASKNDLEILAANKQTNLFDQQTFLKKYNFCSCHADKKGYSGVLTISKIKPIKVIEGVGNEAIDKEGRVLTLEFRDFYLINSYFPHSSRELKRIDFKLFFNDIFFKFCQKLSKQKPLIITGDLNVAHKEIDLANPKQNIKNAGFTVKERAWMDRFLELGFIDTFRLYIKDKGHYTWWAWRNNARERNIGWRIDYFITSQKLVKRIEKSYIMENIKGSDHCPVGLNIKL